MTRKGRKNKRSEQGSLEVEEELRDAKRSNMAATEDEENTEMTENSSTEPSLIEIREMLANIPTSIANIFKKNKSVKRELTELTGTAAPLLGGGGGGRRGACKRAPGSRVCTGVWIHPPPKTLKSIGSEMVFSTSSTRCFLSTSFRQFLYKAVAF